MLLHSANPECFDAGDISFVSATQVANASVMISDASDYEGHELWLAGYGLPGQDTQFHEPRADQQTFAIADTETVDNGTEITLEIERDR